MPLKSNKVWWRSMRCGSFCGLATSSEQSIFATLLTPIQTTFAQPCRRKPKERSAVHPTPLDIMLTGFNLQSSNLIRVRNNQRRSRARRREYVAELERKVHQCNAHGLQPCTPDVVPQDTIFRLEEENRKLRKLLALAGVEQALVDTHLAPEGGVPEAADGDNRLQSSPETAQENLVSLENGNLSMWPSC
jgi:hypothetical protein